MLKMSRTVILVLACLGVIASATAAGEHHAQCAPIKQMIVGTSFDLPCTDGQTMTVTA